MMEYLLLLFQGSDEIINVKIKDGVSTVFLRNWRGSPSWARGVCIQKSGPDSELEIEQQTRQRLQLSGAHVQWGNKQQQNRSIM